MLPRIFSLKALRALKQSAFVLVCRSFGVEPFMSHINSENCPELPQMFDITVAVFPERVEQRLNLAEFPTSISSGDFPIER